MKQAIDEQIDNLPMHEMTGEEALKQIDPNSLKARLNRRQIRYFLYSLRSQAESVIKIDLAKNRKAKNIPHKKVLPKDMPKGFIKKYEKIEGFDGWNNFATTWDVSLHDPEVIVNKAFSEAEEWDRLVLARFPQITPDGGVKYPDMRVKKAVEKEAENQKAK